MFTQTQYLKGPTHTQIRAKLDLKTPPNHDLLFKQDLKHRDSFGKSENLSKIFFAEILVFDHDYEGKSSSSNGLL